MNLNMDDHRGEGYNEIKYGWSFGGRKYFPQMRGSDFREFRLNFDMNLIYFFPREFYD